MRRLSTSLLLCLAASLAAPTALAQQRGPADRTVPTEPVYRSGELILTVDNAFDEPDDNPGDGLCATSFSDCTLRAAIDEANAQPNTQPVDIEFNIGLGPTGAEIAPGVWRIQPNFDSGSGAFGVLPVLAQPNLTIDGETQPGASCGDLVGGVKHDLRVVLDGSLLSGGFDDGLETAPLSINNLAVRGLVVQNFPARGLDIDDAGATGLVECTYIGTDFTGELDRGNGDDGLRIKGTARNNLVSGNGDNGVDIDRNTTFSRNLVGTDADGNQPIGNDFDGVSCNSRDDIIISTNLVSGNGVRGIDVKDCNRVELTNNTIGLTRLRGNGGGGMGNAEEGIRVTSPFDPSNDIDIGLPGAGQGNFVGNNGGSGIVVEGENTSDVRIRGNTVGLTFNGNAAPNLFGIVVGSTFNARSGAATETTPPARSGPGSGPIETIIGGPSAGEGNLIAGNSFAGLILANDISTLVEGNTIGLNASGATRANGSDGIFLEQSTSPTLRGNVVSGNSGNGLYVSAFGGETTGALIEGNTIGLNASGATRANSGEGILVQVSFDPVIRGNTVSGNGGSGIRFESQIRREPGAPAPEDRTRGGVLIEDNFIGTTADGSAARPNVESGLVLTAATPGVTVTGNTISGNTDTGIFLSGGTSGHVIENNFIGTNAAGATLGNGLPGNDGLAGIFCQNASSVRIGQNFQPNTIRFNGKDGIFLAAACQDISVVGNIISDNGELAVDLAPNGPNPNDPGDGDTGANEKLNFPVVTSAENNGTNSIITWTLNARPNTTYELLFCRNTAPDPSGFGECQVPNALRTVTTNGSGNASGTRTLDPTLYPAGSFVSMNATKVDGALPGGYRATSEFGAAVEVADTSGPALSVTITPTSPTPPVVLQRGDFVFFDVTFTVGATGPSSFQFWTEAVLPNNSVRSPLIGPNTVTVSPPATVTQSFSQRVPNIAPFGTYTYRAEVGTFPSGVVDSDAFGAQIVSGTAREGAPADWQAFDAAGALLDGPRSYDFRTETGGIEPAASEALPSETALSGAYPNPFSRSTTVAFALPASQRLTVVVYDVLGREVARLVDRELEAGRHEAVLDGRGLPSGTYLVRISADTGFAQTQRLTLLR